MAVAFAPLDGFTTGHLGRLWAEAFSEFDHTEDQPYIKPPAELFGTARAFASLVPFQMIMPSSGRLWLMTPDNTELVQLQRDWFCRNWRRSDAVTATTGSEPSSYPRYDALVARFDDSLIRLMEYTVANGLGSIRPHQCELTYSNHIPINPPLRSMGDISGLLSSVQETTSSSAFLPPTESGRLEISWVMTPGKSRLRMNLQAGQRLTDQQDAFILTLTARGAPETEDHDGVMQFMNTAHEWIVRGFKEITTPAMHDFWQEEK
jgi:uncharacterized protein (TIGR04255 family)